MLILPQLVKVKTSGNSISYYRNLGYECGRNTELIVDVTKLQKNSGVKVKCNCDVCGKLLLRTYQKYNYQHDDNTDMDYCKDCKKSRIKATCLKKYGVDNPAKLEESTKRMKQTCLEKYGVDSYSKTDDFKEKTKNTFLERYGVECSLQSEEIKEKARQTCLKKYGVENYAMTQECKEKFKKTSMERYGVENPSMSPIIDEKRRKTCMDRYGVEYVGQLQNIKDKIKQTCLDRYGSSCSLHSPEIEKKVVASFMERYGVENSFQSKELREKAKKTMIERYGVEYTGQSPLLREKMTKTLYKNGNTATSSQQIAVYKMLKERYENVEINYPVCSFSLDVALFVYDKKIDIEYDGWYWHQDKQRDRRRDEVLKSQGWSVLRIRSGNKIPTIEQLVEKIDCIINNNIKYSEIVLDDWKEAV